MRTAPIIIWRFTCTCVMCLRTGFLRRVGIRRTLRRYVIIILYILLSLSWNTTDDVAKSRYRFCVRSCDRASSADDKLYWRSRKTHDIIQFCLISVCTTQWSKRTLLPGFQWPSRVCFTKILLANIIYRRLVICIILLLTNKSLNFWETLKRFIPWVKMIDRGYG